MAAPKEESPLSALQQALAQGGAQVVVLHGKERYLLNRAVDLIKEAVLDPRTKDFNYDNFEGKEATAPKVLAACRTLPMMARRRLVLVRDADELNADTWNGFSSYLESPAPEACLCFLAEKPNLLIKFFTLLKKAGLLLKFDPLSERQLPAFVRAEAQRLKLSLSPGVAERIAQEVGADLSQIVDALDRLSCYVEAGAPITLGDVEEVVATTRQHTVFELVDAVGAGDRQEALRLLSEILAAREPALRLLALLLRHVRQLWIARDAQSQGRPSSELAGALGVPPFLVGKFLDQARRLSTPKIHSMHEAIYRTDRALKLSRVDDERHMERLVLKLCQG